MLPASPALPLSSLLTSPPLVTSNNASRWAQAFDLWLNSLNSPNTRRAYASAWSSFQSITGKLPWEVTRADVASFLDALRAAGLSPSTINQRLAALSSFFNYASQVFCDCSHSSSRGIVYSHKPVGLSGAGGVLEGSLSNPAQSIPRLKTTSYSQSRFLTIPEARALLRAISRLTIQGLRDYALFLAYLITGRRNSEIRQLRYGDFEFSSCNLTSFPRSVPMRMGVYSRTCCGTSKQKACPVKIPNEGRRSDSLQEKNTIYYRWSGKGKTRRDQCPFPVWDAIQEYLATSGKLPHIQPSDFIFTPLTDRATRLPNVDPDSWTRNRPLSSREVGRLLKKYARRAGLIPSRIRVHTLRHTAAMLRRQAGDDIDQISSFLGHASLATTQIYLHNLEGQKDSSWMRVADLLGL